mgnify:CR=1 FL=1
MTANTAQRRVPRHDDGARQTDIGDRAGRLGVDVDFPMAQTCCGQAHYNTGYRHGTEPLARHFADVFGEYEAIVTPSGSCGAMVRELYPRMGERARAEGRGDTLAATLAPG